MARLVGYKEEGQEKQQENEPEVPTSEPHKKKTRTIVLVKGHVRNAVVWSPYPGWGEYRVKPEGKSEGVVVRWDKYQTEENLEGADQDDEDFYGSKSCGSLKLLLLLG